MIFKGNTYMKRYIAFVLAAFVLVGTMIFCSCNISVDRETTASEVGTYPLRLPKTPLPRRQTALRLRRQTALRLRRKTAKASLPILLSLPPPPKQAVIPTRPPMARPQRAKPRRNGSERAMDGLLTRVPFREPMFRDLVYLYN